MRDYTPKTIDNSVTAVKSFFKYNDLPLGFVPISKSRAVYMNRDITREEIIKIIDASRPREKAFFALMCQSGLRPSTICQLRKENLEPDFSNNVTPCKITIPAEITKGNYGKYITFIGKEAVDYLHLYFESERPNISNDDLIFASYRKKYKKKKAAKYDRKGESLNSSFSTFFKQELRKLRASGTIEFEQRTNRKPSELRLYNLRLFFRKFAAQAGFENVEYWMGHGNYKNEASYRPREHEYYRPLYAKIMNDLSLLSPDVLENKKTLEQLLTDNKKMEKQMNMQKEAIANLSEKLDTFKNPTEEDFRIQDRLNEQLELENEGLKQQNKQLEEDKLLLRFRIVNTKDDWKKVLKQMAKRMRENKFESDEDIDATVDEAISDNVEHK